MKFRQPRKPGELKGYRGSPGRFQRMVAPWSPPHLGQPTSTRTTVGLPPISAVSHILAIRSVFSVTSVENLGGTVVMVKDIESVVVVVSTVGSVANT
jgi:hypothetical protein